MDQMSTPQVVDGPDISGLVRDVTADEIAFYRENGWAKLDALVDPDLASDLLQAAKQIMGDRPEVSPEAEGDAKPVYSGGVPTGRVFDAVYWQDYHYAARDLGAEPMRSVAFSRALGHNAQRMMGREVGVQFSTDILACKMPAGGPGGAATEWHQDIPGLPFDRVGGLSFWIALNDVPPERGSMRFLSRSQREGSLGRTRVQGKGVIDYYPDLLERYEMSPELTLRPGDATVHNLGVAHGAPANSTDEPRWAYIIAYFPSDALYTGAPNHNFDNIGLAVNEPIVHPRFPQVYP